jgi:hypothetical protein
MRSFIAEGWGPWDSRHHHCPSVRAPFPSCERMRELFKSEHMNL